MEERAGVGRGVVGGEGGGVVGFGLVRRGGIVDSGGSIVCVLVRGWRCVVPTW